MPIPPIGYECSDGRLTRNKKGTNRPSDIWPAIWSSWSEKKAAAAIARSKQYKEDEENAIKIRIVPREIPERALPAMTTTEGRRLSKEDIPEELANEPECQFACICFNEDPEMQARRQSGTEYDSQIGIAAPKVPMTPKCHDEVPQPHREKDEGSMITGHFDTIAQLEHVYPFVAKIWKPKDWKKTPRSFGDCAGRIPQVGK